MDCFVKVLEALAEFNPKQICLLNPQDIDVVYRGQIRKFALYLDYCEATYELLMDKAKEELGLSEKNRSATGGRLF